MLKLKIEKGQESDLDELFQIYQNGKMELERIAVFQWTDFYPNIAIIESDLKKGDLYILKYGDEIAGAITINEEQEKQYQTIDWQFDDSKVLVIHRLVINPKHQRKGYASILMNFAEDFAQKNNYSAIRLDTYTQNKGAIRLYQNRGYIIRGKVSFPGREYPFYCLEKSIIGN